MVDRIWPFPQVSQKASYAVILSWNCPFPCQIGRTIAEIRNSCREIQIGKGSRVFASAGRCQKPKRIVMQTARNLYKVRARSQPQIKTTAPFQYQHLSLKLYRNFIF